MPHPLVSVLMITYNEERYVREAIESVLRQKTDFDFELIIGDDASSDATVLIAEEIAHEHPGVIRLIRRGQNIGVQRNLIETLRECRGRFVALLDGDDYWIAQDKLARQARIMLDHPEYAICFTRTRVIYEDGREPSEYPLWERREYTFADLAKENFVPTCTAFFRQGLLLEIPDWFYNLDLADWALHLLLAQNGDLALIPEATAAYRVHANGVWSRLDQTQANRKRDNFITNLPDWFPSLSAGDSG